MNIIIRKAKLKDLADVYALVKELAIYEKGEQELTASIEDYQNDFKSNFFEVLVAEKENEILGISLYYKTYSTWKGRMLYLEDFVVKENYRSKGIGQLLFDAFLEEARLLDCKMVKWQVLDWNEPALNFYKKNRAIIEKNWWNGKIFLKI